MARYTDAFLNQLNSATDIHALISEYTQLTPAGESIYTGVCPLPDHNETNASLTVFAHTNSWCCYGCDSGYNAISFLMSVNSWTFHQAVDYLCERNHIQKPDTKKFDALFKQNFLREGIYHFRLLKNKENSLDYLLSRGLTLQTMGAWGLGANGKNRIMFPLYDRNKNILEFSMRYIKQPLDKNDKYWHPSNYSDKQKTKLKEYYNKASYLYGIHLYDVRKSDYIYFCEGNLDAILAYQEGLPNCFSTFGTNFSDAHLKFVQTTKKPPVFIYDGDKAGLKGMHKACKLCIEAGVKPYVVILDDKLDLADLALREKSNLNAYILSHITPYSYYVIKESLNAYQSAYFDFYQMFYGYFKRALTALEDDTYIFAKNYIYKETGIQVDADKKRGKITHTLATYCEIKDLVACYHEKLYILQAPYYKIFDESMRTLNTKDQAYAQAYIYKVTGLQLVPHKE